MKITQTELNGVFILEPAVHGDNRGWFMETFRADELKAVGIDAQFVQDNQSFSAFKGTLRGLHFQNYPHAQAKLIRCLRGEILDVAVDMRTWSPNYKKWVGVVLSQENKKQLYIPRGFAHGFLTLSDDVEIAYKVDDYYNKECDSGIRFDDAQIGVEWNIKDPILSQKDKEAPLLKDSNCNFGERILVTGYNGQLGYDVINLLKSKSIECVGVDINDFDITDQKQVDAYFNKYKPTSIIHCAAYTAVDKAEEDKDKCFLVNTTGTANLALAAAKLNAKFMLISTDYVYEGKGDIPHKEDFKTGSLNVYGQSKLCAEQEVLKTLKKHFILRTSWVFGKNGNNFVKTMLRLSKEKTELSVVSDQIGSPTYTKDLARLIVDMIFTDKFGIYNVSNEEFCSWYEFASEIFKQSDINIKLNAVDSSAYAVKAKRPLNSRLDKSKLSENGFLRLPSWKDALQRYLEEIV